MLSYYHLWQMNPTEARKLLVKDYQQTRCYSQTANNFATHRRIVRNTKRASLNFLEYIFSHLESPGAPLEETIYLQTDWGTEYGGHQTKSLKR